MASADTLEIRQLARQFAESELRPHVEQWDHDAALDPAVIAQLSELGFFGMLVPEAFGGMEFDLPTYVSALEEIAWGEPATALIVALNSVVADALARHGSTAQKQAWLEQLASGTALACVAETEDHGATMLTRSGTQAVLNGSKSWVSNATGAQLIAVVTGAGTCLVKRDAPGVSIGERAQTLGLRPLPIANLQLADVQVPADELLPDVHGLNDSIVAMLGIAAIATGIAQAALDHARGYADVREQFKQKLREFEAMQFKLADMRIRIEAARALVQNAAREPSAGSAAMAKIFASEAAMWVTTNAVQIFGGYGYMRDYPVEKLMRDAKAMELMAGVNESLRVLVARELYE